MPIELLVAASFLTWLSLIALAASSWRTISTADPDYAKELFTSVVDQAIYRLGPVRWTTLFFRRAPLGAKYWVIALRVVVFAQMLLVAVLALDLLRSYSARQ